MANDSTTLDTLYVIDDSNDNVTLEILVGDQGQTGDMTVSLDNDVIVEKLAGNFKERTLGTNKQLHGKKLSIVATIADTSRLTNLTCLLIRLRGGVASNDFPLSKTVNEEGDSEDYVCLIQFFNPLN